MILEKSQKIRTKLSKINPGWELLFLSGIRMQIDINCSYNSFVFTRSKEWCFSPSKNVNVTCCRSLVLLLFLDHRALIFKMTEERPCYERRRHTLSQSCTVVVSRSPCTKWNSFIKTARERRFYAKVEDSYKISSRKSFDVKTKSCGMFVQVTTLRNNWVTSANVRKGWPNGECK